MQERTCSVDGCERPHIAKGLCSPHWNQRRRSLPVKAKTRWCSIDGCERKHFARGWCRAHYHRFKRHGDPLAGRHEVGHTPRYLNRNGYTVVSVDGKQMLEHRVVMERLIGRPLEPYENVHHKNGVRTDNDPNNLELWVVRQPKGQRAVDKLAWAREIVATYEPLEAAGLL